MRVISYFFACCLLVCSILFSSCATEDETITPSTSVADQPTSQDDIFREPTSGGREVCRFECGDWCTPCAMSGNWNSGFTCSDCPECAMIFYYEEDTYAPGDPGYDDLLITLQSHYQFVLELETFVMDQHGTTEFTVQAGSLITHADTESYGILFQYNLSDGSMYEVLFINDADGPISILTCDSCLDGCHPHYNPGNGAKNCTPCYFMHDPPVSLYCAAEEEYL